MYKNQEEDDQKVRMDLRDHPLSLYHDGSGGLSEFKGLVSLGPVG